MMILPLLLTGVCGMHGVIGVGNVFQRLFLGGTFALVIDLDACRGLSCGGGNGFLDYEQCAGHRQQPGQHPNLRS